MDADRSADSDGDVGSARNETTAERYDRNWADLLQELRVAQTGVQILTGFLITLPFQQRFESLTRWQVWLFVIAVGLSTVATALLIAPVVTHRLMFQRHEKRVLVETGDRLAKGGIIVLGLAVAAVLLLVIGFAVGSRVGGIAAASAAVLFLVLWLVLPAVILGRQGKRLS